MPRRVLLHRKVFLSFSPWLSPSVLLLNPLFSSPGSLMGILLNPLFSDAAAPLFAAAGLHHRYGA
jgi:hypothetical protein